VAAGSLQKFRGGGASGCLVEAFDGDVERNRQRVDDEDLAEVEIELDLPAAHPEGYRQRVLEHAQHLFWAHAVTVLVRHNTVRGHGRKPHAARLCWYDTG